MLWWMWKCQLPKLFLQFPCPFPFSLQETNEQATHNEDWIQTQTYWVTTDNSSFIWASVLYLCSRNYMLNSRVKLRLQGEMFHFLLLVFHSPFSSLFFSSFLPFFLPTFFYNIFHNAVSMVSPPIHFLIYRFISWIAKIHFEYIIITGICRMRCAKKIV